MKEILENPAGELIGCVLPDQIPVSRTLTDGERSTWEGLDFEVYFSPGHCDCHMSMFTEIDDKRIAFSGNNVWSLDFTPSLIYRNHVHRSSYQISARLYQEYRPEVLCSGHGLHLNVPPEGYDLFYDNDQELTRLFDLQLPQESGLVGLDPGWIQIYPYQSAGAPGRDIDMEVRVRSPIEGRVVVEFAWVVPEGWSVTPPNGKVEIEGGENREAQNDSAGVGSSLSCLLRIPESYEIRFHKQAIALNVPLNGRYMGQIAEVVVEFHLYGSAYFVLPVTNRQF